MGQPTGSYPSLLVDTTAKRVVSQAGSVLVVDTARAVGLDAAWSKASAPWRKPLARHDPGKIVLDLAMWLAIGGNCLADIAQLPAEPGVFGLVASDPTVFRLIDTLAADAPRALPAVDAAWAASRTTAWRLGGADAPDHQVDARNPMVIDLDSTLMTAHSEKEHAGPTFKRGFGFPPLGSWSDHADGGAGERLTMLLRRDNAGSNTAADHITVTKQALAQLPFYRRGGRVGRKVLIRTDSAGGTHQFLAWLAGQGLSYSVGFPLTEQIAQ